MTKRKAEMDHERNESQLRRSSRPRAAGQTTRPLSMQGKSKDNSSTASSSTQVANPDQPQASSAPRRLIINEQNGDLFSAPPNTLLIHACNCHGVWAHGIAAAFKKRYPAADRLSAADCKRMGNKNLPGTAQLIDPQPGDQDQHFVGCLYTSRSYGKAKDKPSTILRNTNSAIVDLLNQVAEWNKGRQEGKVEATWICRINAGLLDVPWIETKKVIEGTNVPEGDLPSVLICMVQDMDTGEKIEDSNE